MRQLFPFLFVLFASLLFSDCLIFEFLTTSPCYTNNCKDKGNQREVLDNGSQTVDSPVEIQKNINNFVIQSSKKEKNNERKDQFLNTTGELKVQRVEDLNLINENSKKNSKELSVSEIQKTNEISFLLSKEEGKANLNKELQVENFNLIIKDIPTTSIPSEEMVKKIDTENTNVKNLVKEHNIGKQGYLSNSTSSTVFSVAGEEISFNDCSTNNNFDTKKNLVLQFFEEDEFIFMSSKRYLKNERDVSEDDDEKSQLLNNKVELKKNKNMDLLMKMKLYRNGVMSDDEFLRYMHKLSEKYGKQTIQKNPYKQYLISQQVPSSPKHVSKQEKNIELNKTFPSPGYNGTGNDIGEKYTEDFFTKMESYVANGWMTDEEILENMREYKGILTQKNPYKQYLTFQQIPSSAKHVSKQEENIESNKTFINGIGKDNSKNNNNSIQKMGGKTNDNKCGKQFYKKIDKKPLNNIPKGRGEEKCLRERYKARGNSRFGSISSEGYCKEKLFSLLKKK